MSKNNCKFVVTKKDDCCYKTTTETVGGLYGVAVPAFPASSTKDSVHVVRYDDALVTYVYNGTAWVETTNTPITSPVIPGVLVDNGDGTYTWTDTTTTFVIDTTDRVLSTVVYSPATQDFTFTWSNGDTTVVDLTGLLNVYSLLDGNNTVVTGNGVSTPWEVNGYGVADNSDGTFTVTLPDGVTTFLIDTNDVVTYITNTVTGNKIADYTNELGTVTPINETITSIVNNGDGTATFTNESGVATTFPIGAVTVVNNGDGTYTITLADGSTVTISDTSTSTLVDNLDGTYTYTDETGAVTTFNTNDTITTLVDNGDGTLTYTSEDGTVTTFNRGFTSVTNNADGTWTYTYPDLSTTTLDICALLAASSCLPTLTDNGDGTYTFNDGQGNTTTFNGGWTTFANSTNGFTATYPDGSTYVWAETITSLVAATNGWEYTSEDGTTTTVTYLFDNTTPSAPTLLVQVNGTTQATIPLNSYDVNITTAGGFTFNPTTDEITITETDGETHVIDLTPLRTTITSVNNSVEIVQSVNPDGSTNYDLGVAVHNNETQAVPYTGIELPVIAGVTVGDTVTTNFTNGVAHYTFDGTNWVVDFFTPAGFAIDTLCDATNTPVIVFADENGALTYKNPDNTPYTGDPSLLGACCCTVSPIVSADANNDITVGSDGGAFFNETVTTLGIVVGGAGLPNTATYTNENGVATSFNYIEGARNNLQLGSPIVERGNVNLGGGQPADFTRNTYNWLGANYQDKWQSAGDANLFDIKANQTVNAANTTNSGAGAVNIGTSGVNGQYKLNVGGAIWLDNGKYSVIVGRNAGLNDVSTENVLIGDFTGQNNTGDGATFVGRLAGQFNTGGTSTIVGYDAGTNNTGNGLSALGAGAARSNTAVNAVFVGNGSGASNTGSQSIGIGKDALRFNSASQSIGIGIFSGMNNTGGSLVSIGNTAAQNNTGNSVVLIGDNAGTLNTGSFSTGIGQGSLNQNSGENAVAYGQHSLGQNSGNDCIGIGFGSLRFNNKSDVIGLGTQTAFTNNASRVIAIGYRAADDFTNPNTPLEGNNVTETILIGSHAGHNQGLASGSEVHSNTIGIGKFALGNSEGSNVIAIGQNAGNTNTQSNRVILGFNELPQFANAAAAAAAMPAASANGVYIYWDLSDNTIKVRP